MSEITNTKPSLDYLMHYGTPRHSGRYPWGSGDEPYQHCNDFLNRIDELKKSGISDAKIAEHFGMTHTDYRKEVSLAKQERKRLEIDKMQSLRDKGYSYQKIAEMMGYSNDSSVRSKLDPHNKAKMEAADATYNFIKDQFKDKKYIDVGKDAERELNVSRTKFDEAIYRLQMEGYVIHERHVPQPTNKGQNTTIQTLCVPGTELKDFLAADVKEIKSLHNYVSHDGGDTFHKKFVYPKSMDSKRLQIRYAEDGGTERDGLIEIRRGVDDLSLGNDRYAQVRILVDNDRYIKGMAVYSDDLPDGVDVVFNTNKSKDKPMRDVLKPIKIDKATGEPEENPFGSSIKDPELGGQYYYKDKNGNEQLGLINKKSSEGDWEDWANTLPSQFLSKQKPKLINRQLNEAKDVKQSEYEEICSLTNPTLKKKLLNDFANECDSAAVHLKAAALPKQRYHVIIPVNDLKTDEVYAPGYDDGEKVALIRYPHAGTFEIPICTVNNKNATARKLVGTDVVDAVCINKEVADRLSGADFDGDTVMVIPTNSKVDIVSTRELKDLKGFDAKMEYGTYKDGDQYINKYGEPIKPMTKGNTGTEMGKISNLITDMTILGATDEEKARAVKHSMVVIDAEKHKLDWKQSEKDNNISALRKKYQRKVDPETGKVSYGGVATLISRAKSQLDVPATKGSPHVNIKGSKYYDPNKPEGALNYKLADDLFYAEYVTDKNPNIRGYKLANGKEVKFDKNDKEKAAYYKPVKKVDKETGEVTFTNSTGELTYKTKMKTKKSTRMAEASDAKELYSDPYHPHQVEVLYGDYANHMKALANKARKEAALTKDIEYSPSAAKVYKDEVASLNKKLNTSLKNSPRERQAVALANSEIDAKLKANPELRNQTGDLKKLKDLALRRARETVGAKRTPIDITDREWEAIQSGAISKTKLVDILRFADSKSVKTRAMPRKTKTLNTAQTANLKAKYNSGNYTLAQLANSFGISVSAVSAIVREEREN